MSYISSHVKGVTPLPGKTQKKKNWQNFAASNTIKISWKIQHCERIVKIGQHLPEL